MQIFHKNQEHWTVVEFLEMFNKYLSISTQTVFETLEEQI